MSIENKKENGTEEIKRGQETLLEAEGLANLCLYNGAVSRLYYYLFYHVRALLLTKGIEPKTHEGVERMFSQHFVKTNIFVHNNSKFLSRLAKYRGDADYNPSIVFTKEDFDEFITIAKAFTLKIRKYLKAKKYIK